MINRELNPLLQEEFTNRMNEMAGVFPNINNKSRLKYYYKAVKDLPFLALKEITRSFLMSSKQMPLPSDFVDAARDWKKKNNFYSDKEEAPDIIICEKCNDFGIVRIKHLTEYDFDGLMNCGCNQIIGEQLKVPAWSNELIQVYISTACPTKWFKPDNTTKISLEDREIISIMNNWENRKLNAEKYWQDLGYIHLS